MTRTWRAEPVCCSRLSGRGWTVEDLAWLTASVSDNTATNALLRLVGRESTARLAQELGLDHLTLHDKVRDVRGADVPPVFATGTARDLARLVTHTVRGTMSCPAASARLLRWMRANTDHGLVPALVDHDPYDPGFPERPRDGLLVANKTGTDTGVRADAGVIIGRRRAGVRGGGALGHGAGPEYRAGRGACHTGRGPDPRGLRGAPDRCLRHGTPSSEVRWS